MSSGSSSHGSPETRRARAFRLCAAPPPPRSRGVDPPSSSTVRRVGRIGRVLALIAGVAVVAGLWDVPVLASSKAGSGEPTPATVQEWLQREHRLLQRYLTVVRQAVHDYGYGYKTPPLLMPITMDFFTGYVARLHIMEETFLYPAIRPHLNAAQLKFLALIETDEREEMDTVRHWQRQLSQLQPGDSLAQVTENVDYLGQLLNRHLVLQEDHLFPVLNTLTPKEQVTILKGIAASEREAFGPKGRQRYEQLLSWIENAIKALGGRVW